MTNLLRISEAASLALHTMAYLVRYQDRLVSTHEIASELRASENHLSKVCQRLVKAGLVEAVRGPKGGLRIGRPAGEIRLLDVYEAVEGPMRPAACLLEHPACYGEACVLGGLVALVNQQVLDYFTNTTLADLTC